MALHLSNDPERKPKRTATPRSAAPKTSKATPRVAVGATTRRVSARTASKTRMGGATPRAEQPRAKKRHVAAAVAAIAVILALAGVLVFTATRCSKQAEPAPAPSGQDQPASNVVEVAVPEGSGGDAIAQELVEKGLIKDAKAFYTAVANLKADALMKPGTYEFTRGASAEDIVRQLVQGPNSKKGRLTVAEGLTVTKTAEAVEKALGIPKDDFLAQAKASNYVDDYPFLKGVADDSLEGYLWASTYDFTGKEVTADSVIRAMLDMYRSQTADIDFAAGEKFVHDTYGVEMDDYDIIKLASIIERETPAPDDYPLVSSVFYNRFVKGMPLQSDATTEYAVGHEPTPDDLKKDSPYNSYLNKGLPPTPICTPSKACIQAALAPTPSDYLYFLLIENGSYSNHTFSKTYEEHLAAIDQANKDLGK